MIQRPVLISLLFVMPLLSLAADAITPAEESSWERAGRETREAWEAAREAGAALWGATSESSSEAWESTRETSTEVWESTRETSREAWDGTRDFSDRTWRALNAASNAASETFWATMDDDTETQSTATGPKSADETPDAKP